MIANYSTTPARRAQARPAAAAPAPVCPAATISTFIDDATGEYDCYVVVDGGELYVGSCATRKQALAKCATEKAHICRTLLREPAPARPAQVQKKALPAARAPQAEPRPTYYLTHFDKYQGVWTAHVSVGGLCYNVANAATCNEAEALCLAKLFELTGIVHCTWDDIWREAAECPA